MKKKRFLLPLAVILISAFSFQSCIGSFSLTNKVLTWNRNVNNKFVNELVFFAFWVLPVYEVTAAADLLVINSIEFWSGNKPLEAHNKVISTDHGDYLIAVSQNGYDIASPDGSHIYFEFDSENQIWSLATDNKEKIDFLKFTEPDHVEILDRKGEFVDVELSPEGVNSYIASSGFPLMALQ